LAHSHGGTVAVKAVDKRDEPPGGEAPDVRALLTLGTPFVRLVWRWGRMSEGGEHYFALLVATILPATLLVLAPLMALDLVWRSNNGVAFAVAAGVLVIALAAAWRVSLVAATTIIAIGLGFGDVTELMLLLTIACICGAAGISLSDTSRRRVLRFFGRHVEDEPVCLPCPLLALRTPRDEASLVIGLGQVVQELGHAGAGFVDLAVRPFVLLAQLLVPIFVISILGLAVGLRLRLSPSVLPLLPGDGAQPPPDPFIPPLDEKWASLS